MTPDEFRQAVLPQVVAAWDDHCFCTCPGFQKLVSFNFRDYGIGPTGLADSEILIDELIRQRFTRQQELESPPGENCASLCMPAVRITVYRMVRGF